MVTFDLPLGVPQSYLEAWRRSVSPAATFIDWLVAASARPCVFAPVESAAEWAVEQPFFRVPPGTGSRTAFFDAAAAQGNGVALGQPVGGKVVALKKTNRDVRAAAVDTVAASVRVDGPDAVWAVATDDDFDAFMTAAAFVRTGDGRLVTDRVDPEAEGLMLFA